MASTSQTSESILIFRLGAMGDVLHAMPAVAGLREALPQAHLGWAIERRWAEFLLAGDGGHATAGGRALVDSVHVVDTMSWRRHPLRSSTLHEVRRALRRMRGQKYQIAVDVQGAMKSAVVAKLSGAGLIYGFSHPRERLATMFYSQKTETRGSHIVELNMELCSVVIGSYPTRVTKGLDLGPRSFELPRSPQADRWCNRILDEMSLGTFAILNPGSGWGAKCWPMERFAEVARRLREAGLLSIANYGPGEQQLADTVARLSGGAAQPLFCSITELIALTRRAALFIGGDTGPLHLAAALKVPVVALFGPTDPARNGPYGTRSVILRNLNSVTSYSHVPEPDPGLQSITVDEVIRAASQLLGVPIG
jgi:heptosyltransferase-1